MTDGRPLFAAMILDITERRQAEQRIERLMTQLEEERNYLREEVDVALGFGEIVGDSPVLGQVLEQIDAVAQTQASVLITGETGVGKDLIAHAVHARSSRAARALVTVNCSSVPKELFESEFFGHVKGSFTGAFRDRIGRFQLADGGTLFLDEVSEIPSELQAKLLRVLESGEFERVGEEVTRTVDVRVVASTNRDLAAAVAAGAFREDLFYRLSVFPIAVPPLRERGGDVLLLARHFLDRSSRELRLPALTLSDRQEAALLAYGWPGNVRELRNVIERAAILSRDGRFDIGLPPQPVPAGTPSVAAHAPHSGSDIFTDGELRALERRSTVAALERCGWKISGPGGAAELLGLKPSTLSYRIKSFGIERPR